MCGRLRVSCVVVTPQESDSLYWVLLVVVQREYHRRPSTSRGHEIVVVRGHAGGGTMMGMGKERSYPRRQGLKSWSCVVSPCLVVEHYPCRIFVFTSGTGGPTTNRSGGRGTFVRRCAGLVDAARQCRRGTPRRRDGFSKTNFAPFGKKTGVIMSPFDLFSEIQRNDFEKASTSGPHGGETVSTTGSTEHQFVSSTGYSSSRTPSRAFGPRQRHRHGHGG